MSDDTRLSDLLPKATAARLAKAGIETVGALRARFGNVHQEGFSATKAIADVVGWGAREAVESALRGDDPDIFGQVDTRSGHALIRLGIRNRDDLLAYCRANGLPSKWKVPDFGKKSAAQVEALLSPEARADLGTKRCPCCGQVIPG